MTINGYWEHWWVEELTPAKARATQYSYRDTYAAYIAPRIGHLRLRQLIDDPHLLIDWRSKLAREKSQSALDHAHRVLSSMLSAATEEGLIPNNHYSCSHSMAAAVEPDWSVALDARTNRWRWTSPPGSSSSTTCAVRPDLAVTAGRRVRVATRLTANVMR